MSPDTTVALLTDAAEGLKFALTDGVDVAVDGTIYFTDVSYKDNLQNQGRPENFGGPMRNLTCQNKK